MTAVAWTKMVTATAEDQIKTAIVFHTLNKNNPIIWGIDFSEATNKNCNCYYEALFC